jgi:hypothetical protein
MHVYTASISYPHCDADTRVWGESCLNSDFTADGPVEAVEAAVRHARNRLAIQLWPGMIIGCIKVYEKHIGPIDAEGNVTTRGGMCFFEWKYDWPMADLDNDVRIFTTKYNRAHAEGIVLKHNRG